MTDRVARLTMLAALAVLAACASTGSSSTAAQGEAMDRVAESYVKLVLAVGRHDPDYVDAYYGPPEWKAASDSVKRPLTDIRGEASALITALEGNPPADGADEMVRLRHRFLLAQLRSLVARADMLGGKRLSFDEESKALYDAVAPTHPESHFQRILDRLDAALPGQGTVVERYDAFRRGFIIPARKLDTVFTAAIEACKERTARHIALPPGESFTVEYVTDKSWSGYNWYQGNHRSLIQVNTDLPIYVDRALDLACHEGYPGHHVYNALLEHRLRRGRGWVEYTAYPLFSPMSLIAEGTANYGVQLAFPGEERLRFERDVTFPLAGLDPARADEYYRLKALVDELSYAGNEAARRYLNGEIDARQAAQWLTRYAMYSPPRAEQRVRFMDQYRSYVINYNLGQDLVREYVERSAGADRRRRWEVFAELISSPRLPGDLR
jgi:hypothetical protein